MMLFRSERVVSLQTMESYFLHWICFQLFTHCTTPAEAVHLKSERSLMYVHLLCALMDRNLGSIEANFAHLVCYREILFIVFI